MGFLGRKKELELLHQIRERRPSQLIVMRGRRRIGKSRLAEEFGKSFPSSYFFTGVAPQPGVTAHNQREEFAKQLEALFNIPAPKADSWSDLFRVLARLIEGKNALLVFDEITWMGGKDPLFLGVLKNAWDLEFKKNSDLFFILSGSISSWIERNILKSTGFLGRISHDLVLRPLSLACCNLFWGKYGDRISAWEKFQVLAVTGGVPRYLEEVRPELSAQENISKLCFCDGGLLVKEFDNIFSDLFAKKSVIYKKIMRFLVDGSKSLEEICLFLKRKKSGVISNYLDDLVTAGFLSRDYTWLLKTQTESKLSRYRISDNYSRFYLKHTEPKKMPIISGAKISFPSWDGIMGLQFENLVLNYRPAIWGLLGINPNEIIYENPYFQRETKNKNSCQIDYLIQLQHQAIYIVEIKFSKKEIEKSVIDEVSKKIRKIDLPKYYSVRPVLIHVNGVKESVQKSSFFSHIIDFGSLLK